MSIIRLRLTRGTWLGRLKGAEHSSILTYKCVALCNPYNPGQSAGFSGEGRKGKMMKQDLD
jgi:hypothetical protein